jgi:serine/threonine protein kinase
VGPDGSKAGADPRGLVLSGQDLNFEVLELVGKGAFGTVYRASMRGAEGFAKTVALKVLNPGLGAVGEMGSRLRDEARMLGLVRHRALVHVDGLVELGGRPTLVMEYIEGADLKALIGLGPVPPGPALEITGEVAAALHAASSAKGHDGQALRLLHRDIKPANVRLTPLGEVKVLDFGVARGDFAAREAATLEFAFGTPDYMAPERLVQHDCAAGDIYAVGAVLYEMITGEPLGRASTLQGRHDEFVRKRLGHLRRCLLGDDEALTPEPGRELATELCAFVGSTLAFSIDARPRAREVERACARLRQRVGGETLRDWAEEEVPSASSAAALHDGDRLAGTVLSTAASTNAGGWLDSSRDEAVDDNEPPTVSPLPDVSATAVLGRSGLAGPIDLSGIDEGSAAAGPATSTGEDTGDVPTESGADDSGSGDVPPPQAARAVRSRPPHITTSSLAAPAPIAPPPPQTRRFGGWFVGGALVVAAGLVGVVLFALDVRTPSSPPAPTPMAVTPPPPAPVVIEAEALVEPVEPPSAQRKRSASGGAVRADAAAPPVEAADLNAHVSLTGDAATAWLTSTEGQFPMGDVPPGSYQIQVQFPDRAPVSGGRVKVAAGQSVVLECTTAAQRCTAR